MCLVARVFLIGHGVGMVPAGVDDRIDWLLRKADDGGRRGFGALREAAPGAQNGKFANFSASGNKTCCHCRIPFRSFIVQWFTRLGIA